MASLRKRHSIEVFRGLPDHYDRVGAVMSSVKIRGGGGRWSRPSIRGPGMRILDVATGIGVVAFALAGRGAEVAGLDQSDAMLSGARARLKRTRELADRLSFVLGERYCCPTA